MLRCVMCVVVLGITSGLSMADEKEWSPKDAKSTSDILKWIDKTKGFGNVHSTEYRSEDSNLFIVWYCPYSGRDSTHFHAYEFDAKKKQWVRTLDKIFDHTHHVTVEVGDGVTIRDVKGKMIHRIYPKK